MNILVAIIWFTGLAFVFFGLNCFYSSFIINEFKRYGLPKYRRLTGWLQLLGAFGLLVGQYYSKLLLFAAAVGLFVLMLSGFIVRLKIKDNVIKSSPSFIFAVLNLLIAIKVYTNYLI
ncbi:DoxX family protein [Olleya sp. YS]|uniref:DoxX family protein n=1 Tax=Olleya sp. YS TaxID=3028318 RepID=UPI0024342439|nr:DoxX family protein [Olleya sp. YS]WGD34530.1 DoxX family protein [Olleya sp. YS]